MPTQNESDLAADAAFMRSILESSNDCIKVLGLDGSLLFMNSGGHRVMEVDDFEKLRGCHWPRFWPGAEQKAAEAIAAAARGETTYFEGDAPTARGTSRFWEVVVSPIRDETGKPVRILSVSRDVTSRREIELQREMLSREIVHRVNNTLAVVGAIVTQSLRVASSTEEADKAISGRIRTLVGANTLLTNSRGVSTTVAEVVKSAIAPYLDAEDRASIDGPAVTLNSRASVALSLAINELSTNATKYGALSNSTGHVTIQWTIDEEKFQLVWKETGGPAVRPPQRISFGTTLIKNIFGKELDGATALQFEPTGVLCRIEVPRSFLRHEG
jgi:PAS domain S-box-containing protein